MRGMGRAHRQGAAPSLPRYKFSNRSWSPPPPNRDPFSNTAPPRYVSPTVGSSYGSPASFDSCNYGFTPKSYARQVRTKSTKLSSKVFPSNLTPNQPISLSSTLRFTTTERRNQCEVPRELFSSDNVLPVIRRERGSWVVVGVFRATAQTIIKVELVVGTGVFVACGSNDKPVSWRSLQSKRSTTSVALPLALPVGGNSLEVESYISFCIRMRVEVAVGFFGFISKICQGKTSAVSELALCSHSLREQRSR